MLKIYRENHAVDHGKPYQVLIDNIPVLELLENEVKDFKIKPGIHKISVKSDQHISNVIEFEAINDGIQEFLVKPDYANNFLSKFFTNTLYGKVGIKIEMKKEFYI